MKRAGYQRFCSLARSLDVVGERWTLVVLQELLHKPRRYNELRGLLPGIGSNVLADRLRNLEQNGVIARVAGAVGEGVAYTLTERGMRLAPAMALFREWGLDEMLPPGAPPGLTLTHDLTYAIPQDIEMHESYEWRVDEDHYHLRIDGAALTVTAEAAPRPRAILVTTTRSFMRRWVAGELSWHDGQMSGAVAVKGSAAAWNRMLLATGYPGRPADIAERIRRDQHHAQ